MVIDGESWRPLSDEPEAEGVLDLRISGSTEKY